MQRPPGVSPFLLPSFSSQPSWLHRALLEPAVARPVGQVLSPPSHPRLQGPRPLAAPLPSESSPALGNHCPCWAHWPLSEPTHQVLAPGTLPGAVPPFGPSGPRSATWSFEVFAKAASCDLSSDTMSWLRAWVAPHTIGNRPAAARVRAAGLRLPDGHASPGPGHGSTKGFATAAHTAMVRTGTRPRQACHGLLPLASATQGPLTSDPACGGYRSLWSFISFPHGPCRAPPSPGRVPGEPPESPTTAPPL